MLTSVGTWNMKYLYFKAFTKGMTGIPRISFEVKGKNDILHTVNTVNNTMDKFLDGKEALNIKLRNNLGRITPYLVARSFTGDNKNVSILRANLVDQRKSTNEDMVLKKWLYSKQSYSEMLYNFDKTNQKESIPVINLASEGVQAVSGDAVSAIQALRELKIKENKLKAAQQTDPDGYLKSLEKEWESTQQYTGLSGKQQSDIEGEELIYNCN